jgi:hypothetical protein
MSVSLQAILDRLQVDEEEINKRAYVWNTVNDIPISQNPVITGLNAAAGAPFVALDGTPQSINDVLRQLSSLMDVSDWVQFQADLPTNPPPPIGTMIGVYIDETHQNASTAWQYTVNGWVYRFTIAPDLTIFYRKFETYNQMQVDGLLFNLLTEAKRYAEDQIEEERIGRETQINVLRLDINNAINQAIVNLQQIMQVQITDIRLKYVPKTRTINGITLQNDIVITPYDIAFKNTTVGAILETIGGSVRFKGQVASFYALPFNAMSGDMYVTEDTKRAYIWDGSQWVDFGEFTINLDNYYTKDLTYSRNELDTILVQNYYTQSELLTEAEIRDQYYLKTESYNRTEVDGFIAAERAQAEAWANAAEHSAILTANRYTDDKFDLDFTPRVQMWIAQGDQAVKEWAILKFVPLNWTVPLWSHVLWVGSPTAAYLDVTRYYVNNTHADTTLVIPNRDVGGPITPRQVGLMIPEDVENITDLLKRVEDLESLGVYVGRSYQTYADLMAGVIESAWTENDFTYVEQDETHRDPITGKDPRTRYVLKRIAGTLQWVYTYLINEDYPPDFDEYVPGLILANNVDGDIYWKTGATGHVGTVVGWGLLKGRVAGVESRCDALEVFQQTQEGVTNPYFLDEINKLKVRCTQLESRCSLLEQLVDNLQRMKQDRILAWTEPNDFNAGKWQLLYAPPKPADYQTTTAWQPLKVDIDMFIKAPPGYPAGTPIEDRHLLVDPVVKGGVPSLIPVDDYFGRLYYDNLWVAKNTWTGESFFGPISPIVPTPPTV